MLHQYVAKSLTASLLLLLNVSVMGWLCKTIHILKLGSPASAGTFMLVDVDLAGIVPQAVFNSFNEELGSRAAKRAARAAADAQAAEKEAAAERAAAAAAVGPSAAELKVGMLSVQ